MPPFYFFPECVRDNAKRRNLLNDMLVWRVEPRHPAFAHWVLSVYEPVEHQATDVHLIIQNSATSSPVSPDRCSSPSLPARARYTLLIEDFCDGVGCVFQ